MANVAPAGVTPVDRFALSLPILVLNGPTKKIYNFGDLWMQSFMIIPHVVMLG